MSHFISVFFIIVSLVGGLELDMFGEVNNQAQILDCCFIDGSSGIVDEAGRGKNGQSEDSGIMGLIFIKGSYSLSVNDDDIDGLAVLRFALDGSTPAPEAFSTRVDGGPNTKALLGFVGIEKHAV